MKYKTQFKNNENHNSRKLHLDKYYTPIDLAKYCIEKTYEVIGKENITEIIEPSAGNGSFSSQIENCIAYDIEPEGENITKQDYLNLEIEHKKGRLIIGNPPYGDRLNLFVRFFKKSIKFADYISFILPISQHNNTQKTYHFDLVYSEDLGKCIYNGEYRNIHCCLNIYKRPSYGMLNKKPNYKLKDVEIIEIRNSKKRFKDYKGDYDIAIKSYGGNRGTPSQIGHEVFDIHKYSHVFCIIIHNNIYKEKIIKLLKTVDWEEVYPMTSTPHILQWQVLKYLKEQIPELK